jgi:AMMECR1 domain-containing protein
MNPTAFATLLLPATQVELGVDDEECFNRADGKARFTTMATHKIDTGVNQPVKKPLVVPPLQ